MKEFRTEISISPAKHKIDLKSGLLTQGSCFANAIGERLASHKIRALINPFGVIYNPESIHKALASAIFNEPLPGHTYLQHQEVFFNYNFHSAFSSLDKDELVSRLANTIGSTHYFLKDAHWLIVTYGTAWVYVRTETGEIVANCHKLPSSMFTKSLMSADAIVSSFKAFFRQLKEFNPDIRIILTVSPVRHIKDSLELNSVSKSILRLACHQLSSQFEDVEYFPAYELMVDDLRDYRFYQRDMLHPTTEAEEYIWEKFMERYFSRDLKEFVKKWKVILAALQHKPFHPETAAHQQFLRDTLTKLEELKPWVKVEEEMNLIRKQMINRDHD